VTSIFRREFAVSTVALPSWLFDSVPIPNNRTPETLGEPLDEIVRKLNDDAVIIDGKLSHRIWRLIAESLWRRSASS
jgi:hypothetical protein